MAIIMKNKTTPAYILRLVAEALHAIVTTDAPAACRIDRLAVKATEQHGATATYPGLIRFLEAARHTVTVARQIVTSPEMTLSLDSRCELAVISADLAETATLYADDAPASVLAARIDCETDYISHAAALQNRRHSPSETALGYTLLLHNLRSLYKSLKPLLGAQKAQSTIMAVSA